MVLRVFACCLLLCASGVAEEVPLASQGRAVPIVVHKDAGKTLRTAATDLADHLGKITGAPFKVQEENAARCILLATRQQLKDKRFDRPLEMRGVHDGKEAYAIVSNGGRLYLVGNTELGVSHAVYDFLERIGCRWFFPNEAWTDLPKIPELKVDITASDRPAILSRRIWYGYGTFDNQSRVDYETWSRRNRMAESFKVWNGHAWQSIIAENKAVFEEHSDYLAQVDGERRGPQLCISNPDVRELAIDWALGKLRKKPELDMVSIETSDGDHHCECTKCVKLGSISDRQFGIANELAVRVRREFPGKMVGTLAYNDHCEPPSFELEPEVYVQLTAGFTRGKYTFDELLERWPKVTKNIGFYEYFSVWLWDFDRFPAGRGADTRYITEQIRRYHAAGATSLSCESGNNWGMHGRGYWLANKLMWKPDADADALLDDFHKRAFGPAAEVMRRYYERLDPGNRPLISETLHHEAMDDLATASRLAATRPDVLERLRQLKQFHHYVRLRWELDRLKKDDPKRKTLTLDALTWSHRTRHTTMNHHSPKMRKWAVDAAVEFDEPSWDFRQKDAPWKVDDPVDVAETERLFRMDQKYFRPQLERHFGSEKYLASAFVPVSEKPAAKPVEYQFQKEMQHLIYSRSGEAVTVTFKTGVIKHYRDRAPASWELREPWGLDTRQERGALIASGRLPQDGEWHKLTIEVPKAGLYALNFEDNKVGWRIRTNPAQPTALVFEQGQKLQSLGGLPPLYFHVPKGRRELHYFSDNPNPHEIRGPDGAVLFAGHPRGKIQTIPVPEGEDGKIWSVHRLVARNFYLMNAPNLFAGSPEALLVLP